MLKADSEGSLRFAPLAGPTAQALLKSHPELAGVDSLVLIEGPTATVRSAAGLRLVRYLGGFWRVFLIGYLIPREIRDSLYDVVAYWRHRVFGRYSECPIPPPAARARFLP